METDVHSAVSRLLRVVDAANQMSVSRSKVYQLMDAGELAYVRIGKSRRIPASSVDQLVARNTVGRTA